jgi:anti-anti-sigma regulatory factor
MSSLPLSAAVPVPAGPIQDRVLVLDGEFGAAELPELRRRLVDALEGSDGDLLIDAHQVTAFEDGAMAALTTARSWAKYHGCRVVFLGDRDGAMAAALRRTGRQFRFPVYPDACTASTRLAADRARRAGRGQLTVGSAEPGEGASAPGTTPSLANPRRHLVA